MRRIEQAGVSTRSADRDGDVPDGRHKRRRGNPARRRYLRAFLTWFEAVRPEFLLTPSVVRRRDASLELAFEGLTPRVVLEMREWSRRVRGAQARRRDRPLNERNPDYVFAVYFEPWPHSRIDNANCLHGHNFEWPFSERSDVGSPSPGWTGSRSAHREAVWRKCLFEPFLRWVNEDLATADAVVVERAESHRWRIIIETDEEGSPPGPTTEPFYDLHHSAFLARAGDRLSDGDPELEQTIEYLEIVALRDGEGYGRTADGILARIEATPAGVA